MTGKIVGLQRFPIKGFSAEPLESMRLHPGDGVPGDRMFGFARHGSGFDPAHPEPLEKDKFVVLLTQAGLAGLDTAFDADTRVFEVTSARHNVRFDLSEQSGRAGAGQWLADYLDLRDPTPPAFVHAAPHRFTDVSVVSPKMMNAISILNLASVRALEAELGVPVDPARFRANIEIDGLPAWWELENIGAALRLGGVEMTLLQRTRRCAATEVNPTTAERDLKLPYLLRKSFGHMDMGAYAQVTLGGILERGADVTPMQNGDLYP